MKVPNLITCSLAAMSIFLASGLAAGAGPTSAPASKPAGKIVATVNGEPIYESELLALLPDDAFQEQLDDMKKSKLKRLVDETVQAQFLAERKVTISEEEISKGVKEFEQMVKTPGCPCCGGGYTSLEQFMKINAFAMPEIRRRVSCDIGMRLYMAKLTKDQTSPQALEESVKKHRSQIEADYVAGYMISFEYMSDSEYFHNEKAIEAKKEAMANQAWQRLKKGDSFEKVAKEMSEDKESAAKGGDLGCTRADYLARGMDQAFRTLEPGAYSPVVKANWGCYIVKRKKLTEADILAAVKEEAKTFAEDQVFQEFKAAREHAKIQYGSPPASAPAPLATKSQ